MSEHGERSVFERPLEALVYAPLGFVLEARQIYPRMVDRGRNQILLARLIGRYATRQAASAAEGALERGAEQATGALRLLGIVPTEDDSTASSALPTPPSPASTSVGPPSDGAGETTERDDTGAEEGIRHRSADESSLDEPPTRPATTDPALDDSPADEVAADVAAVPPVDSLAIPDYDSLAASQVVPRLDALTDTELEAVRCYESGVRGRKTILAKIAQLQAV